MKRFLVAAMLACGSAVAPDAAGAQQQGTPARPTEFRYMAPTDPQSTVRHVLMYQERFLARNGRYSGNVDSLGVEVPRGVRVQITTTRRGYAAVATRGTEECVVFHGDAVSPRPYARTPGRVTCRPAR